MSGVVLIDHHDRIAHVGTGAQRRDDLAQFDAETADLDLLVATAEEVQGAVRAPTCHVAGLVHPLTGLHGERIGDETRGGEIGAAEITQRELCAGNVQGAFDADRRRLTEAVEDEQAVVDQRSANRHGLAWIGRVVQGKRGHELRGFGRAVGLQQCIRARCLQHQPMAVRIGQIAAGHQDTQAGEFAAQHRRIGAQHAGDQNQHRNPHVGDLRAQRLWIAQDLWRNDDDRRAIEQAAPHFQSGRVERGIGSEGDPVLSQDSGITGLAGEVEHGAMWNHHALGHAGGAGGVHDIRRAVGPDRHRGGVVRAVEVQPIQVHAHGVARCDIVVRMADEQRCAARVEDVAHALRRMFDVQRNIGCAAFEDRQLGDDQLQRARHGHGNGAARRRAEAAQVMRQPVGLAIELGVTQRALCVDDRYGVRCLPCLLFESLMDAAGDRERGVAGIEIFQHLGAFGIAQSGQCMQGAVWRFGQ